MCLNEAIVPPRNNSNGSSAKLLYREPVLVHSESRAAVHRPTLRCQASRGWCACAGSSVFQVEAPGLKMASFGIGAGGCSLQHRGCAHMNITLQLAGHCGCIYEVSDCSQAVVG